jgi:hypothetical protein
MLLGALLTSPVLGAPRFTGSASTAQMVLSQAYFDRTNLTRLELEISAPDLALLRQHPRTNVPARVREERVVYADVALHLKGGEGTRQGIDEKPSFTLNFDRVRKGQKFHALDKVHLQNAAEDPSLCREYLADALFRAAGVPAPRVTHARVSLNGRDLGLYLVKEGYDRSFLRLHFANTQGGLYECGTVQDINELAPLPSVRPSETGDLRALWEAAREPDPARRLARLAALMDLDRFLAFIAMEAVLGHDDGYAMNRNNYRVYHDPAARRFVFLPGSADTVFHEETGFYPEPASSVAHSVVQTGEGRRRYEDRMQALFARLWNQSAMTETVRRVQAHLQPLLTDAEKRDHHEAVNGLLAAMDERALRLVEHFAQVQSQLRFDGASALVVGGWQPQPAPAGAGLEVVRGPEGSLLRIVAGGSFATAAWRASVVLRDGRYRFAGRVRTAGVTGPDAAVSLGADDVESHAPAMGDLSWRPLSVDFEVRPPLAPVELRCELRAAAGECWFDPASLRLTRLPP